jgi:hypothetical protein
MVQTVYQMVQTLLKFSQYIFPTDRVDEKVIRPVCFSNRDNTKN